MKEYQVKEAVWDKNGLNVKVIGTYNNLDEAKKARANYAKTATIPAGTWEVILQEVANK